MVGLFSIAVQCDSFIQIFALIIIAIFLIIVALILKSVIKMVLSTIKHYNDASVKTNCGNVVKAELNLRK